MAKARKAHNLASSITVKFTFEKQNDGKLAFPDVFISTPDRNVVASILRKTTSIGLYTDLKRCTPFSYKIGLIKTLLLHHAYEISSS